MYSNSFGKTIKLFLLDADPEGRVICELPNWTGKAFRIPRGKVKDCANRDDLKTTGVYLLFGKADTNTGKPRVYIGESEDCYKRLKEHVSGKDFWNESVVFMSKDQNLNKAHIKYLESRLYELAKVSGRYSLDQSLPTRSSISESDIAELEEFIAYIKVMLNTLGFKVLEPLVSQEENAKQPACLLHVSNNRGADARGKRTPDGFVVLSDSLMTVSTVPSCPPSVITVRDDLKSKEVVQAEGSVLRFLEDCLFSSPSIAAAAVLGRSANGQIEWKDPKGNTLKQIEAEEVSGGE